MDDWNIVMSPTCSQKVHLKLEHVLQHDSVVCCVRFSGDGKYFASGCNKTAALFDVQTGRRVCMFVNDQVIPSLVGAVHAFPRHNLCRSAWTPGRRD